MSIKETSSRQCSVESGLTHALTPVGLLCGIPEKDLKSSKITSDHLNVPQTSASKMAKMKKKMHSPLSRRKSTSSEPIELPRNAGKVFGVSLQEAIKHSEYPPLPMVVVRIVEYLSKNGLKSEGIFRVSGNKKNVEMMKAAFDKDHDADLEEFGDVMAVAGLLKQYLRDLPEPPIPQSLTQDFIRVHTDYRDNDPQSLEKLKDLLGRLPALNYQLVKYLFNFLVIVAEHEEYNKMSAMALAIVFGPNLFRCKDGLEGLKEQGHTNAIVNKFIQDYDTLFPDDDEVSPYATTDLFIQTPSTLDAIDTSGAIFAKGQESSTSDEDISPSHKTTVEISIGKPEPVYACVDKTDKHLGSSASSSTEDLHLYVRSVSPSLSWQSNGNGGNSSHSTTQPQHSGPQGRDVVQKIIKASIKEHLFGPDTTSTDDNEYSPNELVHSTESLEEIGPPLPARNYGPEDVNRPQPKRRKKKQKEDDDNIPTTSVLTVDVPAVENDKEVVLTLDQNSNSILKVNHQNGEENDNDITKVKRDSGILTTLTKNRAPLPANRRTPSLNKRHSTSDMDEYEEDDEITGLPKAFEHPLVIEAKNLGKISNPPPRSPRSSPRVTKSPPSPLSPNKHATVDEVDGGYNPVKELMNRPYKKRGRGPPGVPPLELFKLHAEDDVQLSPRERYDGLSGDEALLSPRSRSLSIDTKRMDSSPKGELSMKQYSRNIHQLKRRIRDFEESFEAEHGRKPSQSEKAPIKKYLTDLNRYRKELKELKEKAKEDSERLIETMPPIKIKQEVSETNNTENNVEPLLTTTPSTVQQSFDNSLRKLQDKRKAVGRNENLQIMSLEELQDEKLCVQKALLQHESVFGRPTTKKDKDVMRPLYDRYRMIKRKLNASRAQSSTEDLCSVSTKSGSRPELDDFGSEEHLFATVTLLPKSKMSPSKDSKSQKRRSDVALGGSNEELDNCSDFGGSQENLVEDKERDAKLHHMSEEELQKQLELAKRDKKKLRKKLKKFEDDFHERTGRRVQRDERGDMENDYREYKQIKARLRLIEVLLSKRQASQTI